MGLPWARLDSNFPTHDKVMWLREQSGGHRAIAVYVFALAWSVGHGTDGHVPKHVAKLIDADKRSVTLLLTAGMWTVDKSGWRIHNFDERQQLEVIAEAKRAAAKAASRKANCVRHHGPKCGCWRTSE